MFTAVEAQLGPVDVLVNNAGIAQIGLFTDLAEQEWGEYRATWLTAKLRRHSQAETPTTLPYRPPFAP